MASDMAFCGHFCLTLHLLKKIVIIMGPLLFICVLRSAMKETGQNLNSTNKIICSDVFKHARLFYSPVFVVFSLCICAHFFSFLFGQLSDAISIIGSEDFPDKWPGLIQEMVSKFETGDFNIINGVLRTAHSLFKK